MPVWHVQRQHLTPFDTRLRPFVYTGFVRGVRSYEGLAICKRRCYGAAGPPSPLCLQGFAEAGRHRARARCMEKGLINAPVVFSFQVVQIISRLAALEAPHKLQLVSLARNTASEVW